LIILEKSEARHAKTAEIAIGILPKRI